MTKKNRLIIYIIVITIIILGAGLEIYLTSEANTPLKYTILLYTIYITGGLIILNAIHKWYKSP